MNWRALFLFAVLGYFAWYLIIGWKKKQFNVAPIIYKGTSNIHISILKTKPLYSSEYILMYKHIKHNKGETNETKIKQKIY